MRIMPQLRLVHILLSAWTKAWSSCIFGYTIRRGESEIRTSALPPGWQVTCKIILKFQIWFPERNPISSLLIIAVPVTGSYRSGAICNGCYKKIATDALHFHCTDCWQFDLCGPCYLEKRVHKHHLFVLAPSTRDEVDRDLQEALNSLRGKLLNELEIIITN